MFRDTWRRIILVDFQESSLTKAPAHSPNIGLEYASPKPTFHANLFYYYYFISLIVKKKKMVNTTLLVFLKLWGALGLRGI